MCLNPFEFVAESKGRRRSGRRKEKRKERKKNDRQLYQQQTC
jgi:hypothetical protein